MEHQLDALAATTAPSVAHAEHDSDRALDPQQPLIAENAQAPQTRLIDEQEAGLHNVLAAERLRLPYLL